MAFLADWEIFSKSLGLPEGFTDPRLQAERNRHQAYLAAFNGDGNFVPGLYTQQSPNLGRDGHLPSLGNVVVIAFTDFSNDIFSSQVMKL